MTVILLDVIYLIGHVILNTCATQMLIGKIGRFEKDVNKL